MNIRITLPNGEATGEIIDSPAGREFASALPLTLTLGDLFEREKIGPLPRNLANVTETVEAYTVGQIAYWPPSQDLVFFLRRNRRSLDPGARHRSPGHHHHGPGPDRGSRRPLHHNRRAGLARTHSRGETDPAPCSRLAAGCGIDVHLLRWR